MSEFARNTRLGDYYQENTSITRSHISPACLSSAVSRLVRSRSLMVEVAIMRQRARRRSAVGLQAEPHRDYRRFNLQIADMWLMEDDG